MKAVAWALATGRSEAARDFTTLAFAAVGIEVEWDGNEQEETGFRTDTGTLVVLANPKFYHPAEVHELIGDPTKAREALGW